MSLSNWRHNNIIYLVIYNYKLTNGEFYDWSHSPIALTSIFFFAFTLFIHVKFAVNIRNLFPSTKSFIYRYQWDRDEICVVEVLENFVLLSENCKIVLEMCQKITKSSSWLVAVRENSQLFLSTWYQGQEQQTMLLLVNYVFN